VDEAIKAKGLEKNIARLDRVAKRNYKRPTPGVDKSVQNNFTNFIQQILVKIGKPLAKDAYDFRGSDC
jgi:hypothetical protein